MLTAYSLGQILLEYYPASVVDSALHWCWIEGAIPSTSDDVTPLSAQQAALSLMATSLTTASPAAVGYSRAVSMIGWRIDRIAEGWRGTLDDLVDIRLGKVLAAEITAQRATSWVIAGECATRGLVFRSAYAGGLPLPGPGAIGEAVIADLGSKYEPSAAARSQAILLLDRIDRAITPIQAEAA